MKASSDSFQSPNYVLVGDNIDKNVAPRYMRSNSQVQSIHAWNSYGSLDRYDSKEVSQGIQLLDINGVSVNAFLPTVDDIANLRLNYIVLCARVLVRRLSYLQSFADCVPSHIQHELSEQMANKSTVVSIQFYMLCIYTFLYN